MFIINVAITVYDYVCEGILSFCLLIFLKYLAALLLGQKPGQPAYVIDDKIHLKILKYRYILLKRAHFEEKRIFYQQNVLLLSLCVLNKDIPCLKLKKWTF